jgi:hypothetical protein
MGPVKILKGLIMEDIYTENGFKNREDYLKHLSENYGIDLEMVQAAADMLGPNEDFDGLVTCIEDGF